MNRCTQPLTLTRTWLLAGLISCPLSLFAQDSGPALPDNEPVPVAPPELEVEQDGQAEQQAVEPAAPASLPPLTPDQLPPPAMLLEVFGVEADDPAGQGSVEQRLAEVGLPDPIANPRPLADPPLAESLRAMLDRARKAKAEGRYYDAIGVLRELHRLAPTHPIVLRELGLAYASSGNTVRGRTYLEAVVSHDPNDREVLLVLARHAQQRGDHDQAMAWTVALKRAAAVDPPSQDTAQVAAYFLANEFLALGYRDAAIALYQDLLNYEPANDGGPAVQREWFIIDRRKSELNLRLGDLLLATGKVERAAQAYQDVDPSELPQPGRYTARLVYCDLLQRDPAAAIEHAVTHLASDRAALEDAAIIDYLLLNQVDRAALESALSDVFEEQVGPLPLLAGLARLLDLDQTLALTYQLLEAGGVDPAAFGAILSVLETDQAALADPDALARVFLLTTHAISRQPAQAEDFAKLLLDLRPDPVALLRTLRRPEVTQTDEVSSHYLAGLAYLWTERIDLARPALTRAVELDPEWLGPRLELARLIAGPNLQAVFRGQNERIEIGPIREAAALIKDVQANSKWEAFELYVRLLQAQQRFGDVRTLIQQRAQLMGLDPELRIFRARMYILTRRYSVADAVADLRELITQRPDYEPAYNAALELIDDFQAFNRFNDNNRNGLPEQRRWVVASLIENLPNSRSALLQQLYEVYQAEGQEKFAKYLLVQMLELDPGDRTALYYLAELYEDAGDSEQAMVYNRRYFQAFPPGLMKRYYLALLEFEAENQQAVVELLTRTLAEEREGVMPGPQLDGDLASSIVNLLGRVSSEEETERRFLEMVRRFPYNAMLNNGLGYRWALAGKNLVQARNMVQRAIDVESENYAYLDSMAWVYYKMGDFAQAEAYQSQALQQLLREASVTTPMRESKAVLYNHMGDIQYQLGELPSAIRNWQYARAQQLTPEEIASDPELDGLRDAVRQKINDANAGRDVSVADVPGEAAFGPEGHPADDLLER
ncbi:MAG: hypothetical protein AAGC44_03540 [Planctomycetota bacterium]